MSDPVPTRDGRIRQAFADIRAGLSALEHALSVPEERAPDKALGTFMATLVRDLEKRRQENGHAYVTPQEVGVLTTHNLSQPGHTTHRFSTVNEDLSDATQAAGALMHLAESRLTEEESDEYLSMLWDQGVDAKAAIGKLMARRVAQRAEAA